MDYIKIMSWELIMILKISDELVFVDNVDMNFEVAFSMTIRIL